VRAARWHQSPFRLRHTRRRCRGFRTAWSERGSLPRTARHAVSTERRVAAQFWCRLCPLAPHTYAIARRRTCRTALAKPRHHLPLGNTSIRAKVSLRDLCPATRPVDSRNASAPSCGIGRRGSVSLTDSGIRSCWIGEVRSAGDLPIFAFHSSSINIIVTPILMRLWVRTPSGFRMDSGH
jgi:hypothetical protein